MQEICNLLFYVNISLVVTVGCFSFISGGLEQLLVYLDVFNTIPVLFVGLFPISEFPRISVIVLRLSKTLNNGFDHKITTQKSGLFFRTDHEPFDENCMC